MGRKEDSRVESLADRQGPGTVRTMMPNLGF